jgi:hypothetical protein
LTGTQKGNIRDLRYQSLKLASTNTPNKYK